MQYCPDLDKYLKQLIVNGATKFPSVSSASWRMSTYKDCLKEIGDKSYGENLPANLAFLDVTNITNHLLPALVSLAKKEFKYTVNSEDVYNVCRLVRPGDVSEGYRGHFDSHLFTLVTPINIPNSKNIKDMGQLHYFPRTRAQPSNEIVNISGKIFFKKYNSENGFFKLSQKVERIIDSFQDYKPLLFVGNTTFHGNSPVDTFLLQNRMTILTHFFDISPRYGVGKIMRSLRSR